jgi:hypothetical protein
MELLAVSTLADEDPPGKVFYLCPNDSIENLGAKVSHSTANFGLFIALDGRGVTDDSILQGAKNLLSQGLACLCTWGPDCERVHDLFDVAAREINSKLSDDDVIMTTWHSGESLEEALWYFAHSAFVTRKFEKTCNDWIITPVSNPEWEKVIRREIAQINSVTEDD